MCEMPKNRNEHQFNKVTESLRYLSIAAVLALLLVGLNEIGVELPSLYHQSMAQLSQVGHALGDAFEFGVGTVNLLQLETDIVEGADFLSIAKAEAAQALPAIFTP